MDLKQRLLSKIKKTDNGCWEWQGRCDIHGYGKMNVDRRTVATHRLSFSIFKGEIPNGRCVCHRCDNRKCCNPDHLFIGTQSDNIRDCVIKGRHPTVKLSPIDIFYIRNSAKKQSELAAEFNVHQSQISRIKTNKQWSYV